MAATILQAFEPPQFSNDANPSSLTDAGNLLFFQLSSPNQLWRSDGTENGTILLLDSSVSDTLIGDLANEALGINGNLFFSASNDEFGRELWISNGTSNGTSILKDINPVGSSNPGNFTNVNRTVFFTADNNSEIRGTRPGEEFTGLWKSDGTENGTELVIGGIEDIDDSIEFNDNLFFIGRVDLFEGDLDDGVALWTSDGTAEGTQALASLPFGGYGLTVVEDTLFFTDGFRLWRSDGTSEGTELFVDLDGDVERELIPFGTNIDELTTVGDTLFFTHEDPNLDNGKELWKTDGTAEGTQLVKDIRPEQRRNGVPFNEGSNPEGLINVNGTLFFNANDGVNGRELWRSDGTEAGTQLVQNITEDSGTTGGSTFDDRFRDYYAGINDTLYFFNTEEFPRRLWQSDGTEVGTVPVDTGDIPIGLNEELIESNGQLFFTAGEGSATSEQQFLLTLSDF